MNVVDYKTADLGNIAGAHGYDHVALTHHVSDTRSHIYATGNIERFWMSFVLEHNIEKGLAVDPWNRGFSGRIDIHEGNGIGLVKR